MDLEPEIIKQEIDFDYEWVPEQIMWFNVVVKYLFDLDSRCEYMYKKIIPKQASLINNYFNGLSGEAYWNNRYERNILKKTKARIRRELFQLKCELENEWFEQVCGMSDLNYDFVKNIAYELMQNKTTLKNPFTFRELLESVFSSRRRDSKPQETIFQ